MPSTELSISELSDETSLLDLMLMAKLIASKGEGRRLVVQGGVSLAGEKVTDPNMTVNKEKLSEGIVIKKGKKVYHKVIAK